MLSGRWLGARQSLHAPALGLFAASLFLVHAHLLASVTPVGAGEGAYLCGLAIAQSAAIALTALGAVVTVPKLARAIVGAAYASLLLGYADALVSSRADVHLPSLVSALLDARLDANRQLLDATGIDARVLVATPLALAGLAAMGVWVDAIAERRGVVLTGSRAWAIGAWVGGLLALVALERGAGAVVSARAWTRFTRSVPQVLGALGPPARARASFRAALRPLPEPSAVDAAIGRLSFPSEPPPGDVFFFVLESLRADALDPQVAPTMASLRARSLPIDAAVAGGNVTQYGWFALFTSRPALYWRRDDAGSTQGAIPLRLAHRRGWRVELLASSDPRYMRIDETLFGPHDALADALLDESHAAATPAERDVAVMRELATRAQEPHAPTVFVVALDATHLPYTWAPDFHPPRVPFAPEGHYLRVQSSAAERDAVERRYRNAVAFEDSLVAAFFADLRARGAEDDATWVLVGDHGEELGEHGAMAHGSEPCAIETHVPLVIVPSRAMRAGADWSKRVPLASAIDVWPTLLDAAGVWGDVGELFDGRSLLGRAPRAAVTAQQRLWYRPSRFVLDDGEERVDLELTDPDAPFRAQPILVRDWADEDERPAYVEATPDDDVARLNARFGATLDRLFAR